MGKLDLEILIFDLFRIV